MAKVFMFDGPRSMPDAANYLEFNVPGKTMTIIQEGKAVELPAQLERKFLQHDTITEAEYEGAPAETKRRSDAWVIAGIITVHDSADKPTTEV